MYGWWVYPVENLRTKDDERRGAGAESFRIF